MRFGYTIVYVENVRAALAFFKTAFDFETRFFNDAGEAGQYGELDTGDTVLSFASFGLAESNLPASFMRLSDLERPAGIEVAIVTDDVPSTITRAIDAGAELVAEAREKPWGQTVGYVRATHGLLIEVCTAVGE